LRSRAARQRVQWSSEVPSRTRSRDAAGSRLLRHRFLVGVQFALYFAVWITGIYINGYVFMPSVSLRSVLTQTPIFVHALSVGILVAVSLAAAVADAMHGERRRVLLRVFSLFALLWALVQGVLFLVSAGSGTESLGMALGFIAAFFLSFGAALPRGTLASLGRPIRALCALCLALSFFVFASGVYLNLNAATNFFSLPSSVERMQVARFISGPQFVVHATLGTAYVLATGSLLIYTLLKRKFVREAALSFFLSAYPALFGLLNVAFVSVPEPVMLAASIASASSFFFSVTALMYAFARMGNGGSSAVGFSGARSPP